jgi:hypothetical protein
MCVLPFLRALPLKATTFMMLSPASGYWVNKTTLYKYIIPVLLRFGRDRCTDIQFRTFSKHFFLKIQRPSHGGICEIRLNILSFLSIEKSVIVFSTG